MQYKEDQRLIQFLMKLINTFAPTRSNILMINPLPSVNYAYTMLMQDKNQIKSPFDFQFPRNDSSFTVGSQSIS